MSSPAAAITLIEANAWGAADVVRQLEVQLEPLVLLELFRKYFPKEFGKLQIRWGNWNQIMQACTKFMGMVDARLFPCHVPIWEEFEESQIGEIMIYAPWPAWWEGYDLSPLERLILQAVGELDANGEHVSHSSSQRRRILNSDDLEILCSKRRDPLRHLALAASFVFKSTGNMWCDLTDEEACQSPTYCEWNGKSVDNLAREWIEAKTIAGKFMHLQAWLGEKPARVKTARQLIEKAMREPAPRPESRSLAQVMSRWTREDGDDDFE